MEKRKRDELLWLMQLRHSVRQYEEKPLSNEDRLILEEAIKDVNVLSGLHVQLVCDESKAFSGMLAHYGNFSGVSSYIALVGPKGPDLEERCGWWGEQLVLLAQKLGLNSCWTALTYSRKNVRIKVGKGERLCMVIALGYGKSQGKAHWTRSMSEVSTADHKVQWFEDGVRAALLAPTAVNQQKFHFTLVDGNKVKAVAGLGFYSKVDLGIAKYHFEVGAGKENFTWTR